jgi:hypothetical protein
MKMIKRTLIAIAVVALLASTVHAGSYSIWDPYYFSNSDRGYSVKVDGKETKDFRWPYTITYQSLTICNIPVKMKVGMYVQIENCKDKKILLEQVPCADIGKSDGSDYPCYLDCETFNVRANFEAKMGATLHKEGSVIEGDNFGTYYDGGDVVPGDGDYHEVKLCVKAWKAAIFKAAPGDEVTVGSVDVTVKPN